MPKVIDTEGRVIEYEDIRSIEFRKDYILITGSVKETFASEFAFRRVTVYDKFPKTIQVLSKIEFEES